tara:strand:- start:2589 stop:3419 length:831 start_codon:yes stop_codon:yes gene_type:complete
MTAPEALTERWIQIESRAVFRLTGPDRIRFLNGQVSNDVSGILDKEAVAACLCTLKGKVEALVWISADGDSLVLDGELGQRQQIYDRLDRYLIADDCEIHDETGGRSLIHHFQSSGPGVRSRRTSQLGFDLWLPTGAQGPFTASRQISEVEFALAQMSALVPRAGYEITGEEFPAELGLDGWAVDFHKGCYLGQEIISRIHSVGRVKRQIRLLKADFCIEVGAKIRNEWGEIGRITGPPVSNEKNEHLMLGLFGTKASNRQPIEFQALNITPELEA